MKTNTQHRNEILDQGRTDFDEDSHGLTGKQKVDLYGFYYAQMHFTSNYICFLNKKPLLQEVLDEGILYFIDIGCGPMTAGIAFDHWLKKHSKQDQKVVYIGIDISSNMITKSKAIINNRNFNLQYHDYFLDTDKNEIIDYIREKHDPNLQQSFIINYSFLFASKSLNVQEFVSFTNKLYESTKNQNDTYAKFIILYQNPTHSNLSTSWVSYSTKININESNSSETFRYSFCDIMNSCNYPIMKLTARLDIVKSY
ncbi:MAG: class I SAM-dependent methyltransferase [Aureispira sp.]